MYGTQGPDDWQTYMVQTTVDVPSREWLQSLPDVCRQVRRGAYAFAVTRLQDAAYAQEIVAAAQRLADKTTADIIVLVNRHDYDQAGLAALEAGVHARPQVQIRLTALPLLEADLPASVAVANKENANCCGWTEFMKLEFWRMHDRYDRIVSLDIDICACTLRRSEWSWYCPHAVVLRVMLAVGCVFLQDDGTGR